MLSREELKDALQREFVRAELDTVVDFLINQGISSVESALDYHTELSEDAMFNWIHDERESPSQIRNAKRPSEMGNVLMNKDGSCYFWYELDADKPPYRPWEEKEKVNRYHPLKKLDWDIPELGYNKAEVLQHSQIAVTRCLCTYKLHNYSGLLYSVAKDVVDRYFQMEAEKRNVSNVSLDADSVKRLLSQVEDALQEKCNALLYKEQSPLDELLKQAVTGLEDGEFYNGFLGTKIFEGVMDDEVCFDDAELLHLYKDADSHDREVIDKVLTNITGWNMESLLHQAMQEQKKELEEERD